MIKLFLLGLFLLCFLGDGDAEFLHFWEKKELHCAVCAMYSKGICLKGEGTCSTESERGCRSQLFYMFSGNGWTYSYAKLGCSKDCRRPVIKSALMYELIICCGNPFCNKKLSFIQ